jgi:hypothetical protein
MPGTLRHGRLIAGPVERRATHDGGDVFGEIERCGDDDHGEEEEEKRVYSGQRRRERHGGRHGLLKMNFSVGVSMYSEKVTSYW